MMFLLNSAQILEWIQKTLALISLKKSLYLWTCLMCSEEIFTTLLPNFN